ncbi:hypothetical protein HYS94_05385 [Candidatus Daviesbacteria bacterium]|nr:hypothetical protein [Candidatus Daviesbacteria bacterium]
MVLWEKTGSEKFTGINPVVTRVERTYPLEGNPVRGDIEVSYVRRAEPQDYSSSW